MNLKKLLAGFLCVTVLLGFAGCSKKEESTKSSSKKPITSETPEAAGVLFVSIGTEFKVIYDVNGKVMALDAMNETASDIEIAYTAEAIGQPCDIVVAELVKQSIDAGKHPHNRVVVLKQAPDSDAPSTSFLENVRIDTQAVTDYEVLLITADKLNQDGTITAAIATDILTRQLKLTDVTVSCTEVPVEGEYTLTFEIDGAEQEYKVDATTGTVVLESLPSDLMGPNFDDPDMPMDGEPMDQFGDPAYDDYQDSPMDENM